MSGRTVRIKMCGITRSEDARLAVQLGVEMLGFVCWPQSPRFITPERIRDIVDGLPASIATVGVFVDQPVEAITHTCSLGGLSVVQLHGNEPESEWSRVGLPVIKAIGVTGELDVRRLTQWPDEVTPLLDASDPIRRGGTGRVIDWRIAAQAASMRPILLSGGLTPLNVAEAVATVRPWAVDVSSGIELKPGVKDARLMRAFVEAAGGRTEASEHDDE